jgi:hypothetical protein
MKKALVLTAALCLMASTSRASILEAWLTFSTGGVEDTWPNSNPCPTSAGPTQAMVGQLYTVELWIEIVADPNIPGEVLTGCGLDSCALTIVTTSQQIVTEPNMLGNDPLGADTTDAPQTVDSYFPNAGVFRFTIHAAREQYPFWWGDSNNGLDALQMTVSTDITTKTVAVNKPFLYGEENWLLESWNPNILHLEIAPTSNHWDSSGDQVVFSQFETGTLDSSGNFVPGPGLAVGPVPEPATLALLGLGAVAALRRRGKSRAWRVTTKKQRTAEPQNIRTAE